MAIQFPSSPVDGQEYAPNGVDGPTWQWDAASSSWRKVKEPKTTIKYELKLDGTGYNDDIISVIRGNGDGIILYSDLNNGSQNSYAFFVSKNAVNNPGLIYFRCATPVSSRGYTFSWINPDNSSVFHLFWADTDGNLTAAGDITANSDIRIKENIEKITKALPKLEQLNGYTFNKKDKPGRYAGVIAQEVNEVLPEAVFDEDDLLSVSPLALCGLLVEAVKELKKEVDELKERLK